MQKVLFSFLFVASTAFAADETAPWLAEVKTRYPGKISDLVGAGLIFNLNGKSHLLVVSHLTQGETLHVQLQGKDLALSEERLAANAWDLEVIRLAEEVPTPWTWNPKLKKIVAEDLKTSFRYLRVSGHQIIPLADKIDGVPIGWEVSSRGAFSNPDGLGTGIVTQAVTRSLNTFESVGAIRIVPGMSGSPLIADEGNYNVIMGMGKAFHRYMPLSFFASEAAIARLIEDFQAGERGHRQQSMWKFDRITYRTTFGFTETTLVSLPSGTLSLLDSGGGATAEGGGGATAEGGGGATAEGGNGAIAEMDNRLLSPKPSQFLWLKKLFGKAEPGKDTKPERLYPYMFSAYGKTAYALRLTDDEGDRLLVYSPLVIESLHEAGKLANVRLVTDLDELALGASLRFRAKQASEITRSVEWAQGFHEIAKLADCQVLFKSSTYVRVFVRLPEMLAKDLSTRTFAVDANLSADPSLISQSFTLGKHEVNVDLTGLFLEDRSRVAIRKGSISQRLLTPIDVWIKDQNFFRSYSCRQRTGT